jgi:hypothetical protein
MTHQCRHCKRFHDEGLDFGRALGHVFCCERYAQDILIKALSPYYTIIESPQLVLGNTHRFGDLLIVAKPGFRRNLHIVEALVECKRGFGTDGDVQEAYKQAEDESNALVVDPRVYGDYFLSKLYDRKLPVFVFPVTHHILEALPPPPNVGGIVYEEGEVKDLLVYIKVLILELEQALKRAA